jgi:predicted ester cyclase
MGSHEHLLDRYMTEVWNNGNYDVAYELVHPEMIVHGAGGQDIKSGPEGIVALIKTWRAAFPNGRMVVHDVISQGDLFADRLTWVGTQTGEFYGIPPTGKQVNCTSIGFDRVVDGQITEGWGELDMLGMMQQLGAVRETWPTTPGTWEDTDQVQTPAEDGSDAEAIVLRYFKYLNDGDEAGLREIIDVPTYVNHNPTIGRGDFRSQMDFDTTLLRAMPDLTITPDTDHLITQGDRAFVRWWAAGSHSGESLFGVAPSGTSVDWTGSDIVRVAGGRVVESWSCADLLRLMQQIGVLSS